jgi:hypothetical protein
MSVALGAEMVAGMDDMAGLLPAHPPAAQHSAFFWKGQPSALGAQLKPSNKDRSHTAGRNHITLTGRAQGQRDADRRDALKRGGI